MSTSDLNQEMHVSTAVIV